MAHVPEVRLDGVQAVFVMLQLINSLIRCIQAQLQGVTLGGEPLDLGSNW